MPGPIASINRPSRPKDGGPAAYLPTPFTGERATQAQIPPHFIRFWPAGYPANAIMVPMGSQGWRVNSESSWDSITRPFGRTAVAWRGLPAVTASVDVILDRHSTEESVQPAWDILRGLMNHGPTPVTEANRAPVPVMVDRGSPGSEITGGPGAKGNKNNRWVITSIEVDDEATIRSDAGNLIRVEASITLLRYTAPQALQDSKTTIRKVTRAGSARPKPYKAKRGDTLLSIARRELNDASRWRELQRLNPKIRDPRKAIQAGAKIKLPR